MPHPGPAARRHVDRHGQDIEIVNYEFDGTKDKYGDPVGFTKDTTQAKGIFEESQDPVVNRGPDGEDMKTEERIIIKDNVEIHIPSEDDRVKATRIKNLNTGYIYKVFDDWNDNNGIIYALCREVGK